MADSGLFCVKGGGVGCRAIVFGLCHFPNLTFQDGETPGADPVAHLLFGPVLKGFTYGTLAA